MTGIRSIDAYLDPSKKKETVPYWNYFLLKYQFFILYFMAGMKKGSAEWLSGYSVLNLSEHWVFDPFKFFLTVPQIDYLIVHCFIFVFDLTIAMWMMWGRTRHVAMIFCAMFHLMNSRLFTIGMFPWVCLATMPLFYPFDWPKIVGRYLKDCYSKIKSLICSKRKMIDNNTSNYETKQDTDTDEYYNNESKNVNSSDERTKKVPNTDKTECDDDLDNAMGDAKNVESTEKEIVKTKDRKTVTNEKHHLKNSSDTDEKSKLKYINQRKYLTTILIIIYVFLQAFLPYSHFITKGYNNWTDGMYGYSWDMMVHTWAIDSTILKIVDNENNLEYYIEPDEYAPNGRWSRHGDMLYQFAKCLNKTLLSETGKYLQSGISKNISLYFEIWVDLNYRFTQRMFDSKVDMLKAKWSPFENVPYLMPMLDEAEHWRTRLQAISEEVYSWHKNNEVLFFADVPGYELEKFITSEVSNATLTILEGEVAYMPKPNRYEHGFTQRLTTGDSVDLDSDCFHKVLNIGNTPAYYMFTFRYNTDMENIEKPKLPIFRELADRLNDMIVFGKLICENFYKILVGCNGKCLEVVDK
ncbi:vitamin k-dependent gamma-carboxylase domain-containing protein [Phthorimaea operculella]|nr:vitamin k-dependent gamma-carboxylase domain-containing protein [Phthorimaea operculella]